MAIARIAEPQPISNARLGRRRGGHALDRQEAAHGAAMVTGAECQARLDLEPRLPVTDEMRVVLAVNEKAANLQGLARHGGLGEPILVFEAAGFGFARFDAVRCQKAPEALAQVCEIGLSLEQEFHLPTGRAEPFALELEDRSG